jgi:two-component system, cell cycle sensor histidine kinase and response regulator CckA
VGLNDKITVLVVDDEYLVRALLAPVLTKQGHTVLMAQGGEEGIELFSKHSAEIDLIITDITMPCVNGFQMVEAIRNSRPDARVLFISGIGDQLPAWASETCGFLLKPFRIPQLLDAIAACLERQSASALEMPCPTRR